MRMITGLQHVSISCQKPITNACTDGLVGANPLVDNNDRDTNMGEQTWGAQVTMSVGHPSQTHHAEGTEKGP